MIGSRGPMAAIGFRIFSPKQTQLQHLPPANCSEPSPRIHSFCVARLHVACRFPHLQTQNIHLPTRPKIQTQLKICSSIGGWKALVPATAIVPVSTSKCDCGVIITSAYNSCYAAILSCKLIFQSSRSNVCWSILTNTMVNGPIQELLG